MVVFFMIFFEFIIWVRCERKLFINIVIDLISMVIIRKYIIIND